MRKIINSETVQFQDIITDNLVLDAKATEGSFNAITSDAVFRAVQEGGGGGGGAEIPEHDKEERGKYLRVNELHADTLEWSDVDVDLTGGDGISIDNKQLNVNAGDGLSCDWRPKTERITDTSEVTAIEQGLVPDTDYSLPYLFTMDRYLHLIGDNSSFHLGNSWWRASTDFNDPDPTPFYWAPAIVLKSEAETVNFVQPFTKVMVLSTTAQQSTEHYSLGAQMIESEQDGEGVIFGLSFDDINSTLSNLDLEEVQEEPENYVLTFVLVNSACDSFVSGDRLLGGANYDQDWAGTFAYDFIDYKNCVNVDIPVPSYSDSDAGKVLAVNGAGTGVEWAAGGGGVEIIDLPLSVDGDTAEGKAVIGNLVNQISGALDDGKIVVGKVVYPVDLPHSGNIVHYLPLTVFNAMDLNDWPTYNIKLQSVEMEHNSSTAYVKSVKIYKDPDFAGYILTKLAFSGTNDSWNGA